MEVQARQRGSRTYYYLVHSYREHGKVRKLEKYLGRRPPFDLVSLKEELRVELFSRTWEPALEQIKAGYRANLRKMPPVIREKELETFTTRFTYDSNRIEGSSLTFRDTLMLLQHGESPKNRPVHDIQETLAHHAVFLRAITKSKTLDLPTLLEWHDSLFRSTKPELAGNIRDYQIAIGQSAFRPPPPDELERRLRLFFSWLRASWNVTHPVVLAALVHLKLVTIHPFGDGNGRVTRIAMNFVLHRKGFPMHDIAYIGRAGYYNSLQRSQVTEDEFLFVRWFLRKYLQENKRLIR